VSTKKPYCGGRMTKARREAFVMSALRAACRKWRPIADCKRKARTERGFYRCNECRREVPATTPAVYKSGKKKGKGYRRKNVLVDHIKPIVDPAKGFESWDKAIDNMFCEADNLQVLCHDCHQKKCKSEREQRKAAKNDK